MVRTENFYEKCSFWNKSYIFIFFVKNYVRQKWQLMMTMFSFNDKNVPVFDIHISQ